MQGAGRVSRGGRGPPGARRRTRARSRRPGPTAGAAAAAAPVDAERRRPGSLGVLTRLELEENGLLDETGDGGGASAGGVVRFTGLSAVRVLRVSSTSPRDTAPHLPRYFSAKEKSSFARVFGLPDFQRSTTRPP